MSATSLDDISSIVSSQRAYFLTHVTKTYAWRHAQLNALHRLIMSNETAITAALKLDLGKSHFEAASTEVFTVATDIAASIAALSSWMAPESVATPLALLPASSAIRREPFGVVLIIAPFNYPFQLTALPLAAAIAAGNTAVIKPSDMTPATSALLASLLPAFLDAKAVTVVSGGVEETTALLKQKFDYIFFTGSESVGKIVMKAAAEHLTPVTLELGGKSPTIVDATADIALAARRVSWGKYLNAGQSCIAPDYVFVHAAVHKQFTRALVEQIGTFYGADPVKSPDFGRIINERHTHRLKSLIEAQSSDIITGGKVIIEQKYVAPMLMNSLTTSKCMEEEIFGPILPIIAYNDVNNVIDFINSKPKPLALYIFSTHSPTIDLIIDRTSSGGVTVNDSMAHFGNPNLPFGGVGASGLGGAYHGKHGYLTLSHAKSILTKSIYLDAAQRYPPYTEANLKVYRYIAQIYSINSETFQKMFKWVFLPIIIAVGLHSLGFTVTFKSKL